MTVSLVGWLILVAVIATIGADILGFAATLLTVCAIVGFAIAASGSTVSGRITPMPSTRPTTPHEKSLRK
ncbi:hypothetical protein [Bradyrhizobium sp. NAS96.2]|uniref:hypothetical protein n=1 Tax=Bradyrhizobium sp. NAS96.2 TaxID=1680160 RepID=UPI00116154F7|nr:hypothetical protein [Bradyrhizobium sp. NAS96.2]